MDEEHVRLHAAVPSDNAFQRKARLLQARWRDREGLPIGLHRGIPLGSRLDMPFARESLANYLTENVRSVVRREVLDPVRSRGKLFGQPRIFCDLLSSQPMCFNLFAELALDLPLASRALARLAPQVQTVTGIDFEHSPGRADDRYTGDRSAFDVYILYETPEARRGFLAIEVKYHENLAGTASPHRTRYDEIAAAMSAFRTGSLPQLQRAPLQQVWRDHLLAGSLLQERDAGFDEGSFVFLYPQENRACADAVAAYRGCLTDERTFVPWTLEHVVQAIRVETTDAWIARFSDRYLGL